MKPKKKPFRVQRYERILTRQEKRHFGTDYRPAIEATRSEAPGMSRPTKLSTGLLERRTIHLLSMPELSLAILALHHPKLFELKEQLMLPTDSDLHPLEGHPLAAGLELPALKGTIRTSEAMGQFELHPTLWIDTGDGRYLIPDVLVGDLLLFLTDDLGPYCVNWSVKNDPEGFREPIRGDRLIRNAQKAKEYLHFRHSLEARLYGDAGIRTVHASPKQIHPLVIDNLRRLIPWTLERVELPASLQADVLAHFQDCLSSGFPILELIGSNRTLQSIERHELLCIFNQSIWFRRLRVDLTQPILINRPLKREREDILHTHAEWFAR